MKLETKFKLLKYTSSSDKMYVFCHIYIDGNFFRDILLMSGHTSDILEYWNENITAEELRNRGATIYDTETIVTSRRDKMGETW